MMVPGGHWVPVDWQICRELGLMAMVLAPRVWRRRPSRGRMDGSILMGGFSLLMSRVYGGFDHSFIWHLEKGLVYSIDASASCGVRRIIGRFLQEQRLVPR